MFILYFVSEVGGVFLAIVFHPETYGVGASCAGFGLVGFLAAYIITNFFYMGRTYEGQRWYLILIVVVLFCVN